MRSAEIKYLACLLLLRIYGSLQKDIVDIEAHKKMDIVGLTSAAFINAAACRTSCAMKQRQENTTLIEELKLNESCVSFTMRLWECIPQLDVLCTMSPLDLVDRAISAVELANCFVKIHPYASIILLMKKALISEACGRYCCGIVIKLLICNFGSFFPIRVPLSVEVLVDLDTRLRALITTKESIFEKGVLYVSEYAAGRILTQTYMSGAYCEPINYSSDEIRSRKGETLYNSTELLKIQLDDVAVKLAKLKLKFSP